MSVAGCVVAFAYAALAIGNGLDRMAELDPAAAEHVPARLAVNAARTQALDALRDGDFDRAFVAARLAVARDPVDARSVALFGETALLQGDPAFARRAFDVSKQLGWREPLTQLYWLAANLERRDFGAAADRVDAILRQTPDLERRNLYLAPLDAKPAGRAALAGKLRAYPAWAATYFNDTRGPAAGDPMARSETAMLLAARYRIHDCRLVSPLVEALYRHAHTARAYKLYALHCAGPGEPAAPIDGGFEHADTRNPQTVLDWRFTSEGAIGVLLEPVGAMRGRAAVVTSTAPITMPFASQPLALRPGAYRVSWRAIGQDGAPSSAIGVSLACNALDHKWLEQRLADRSRSRFAAAVSVPVDCPNQSLTLGIASDATDIAVDDIAITRASTESPTGH